MESIWFLMFAPSHPEKKLRLGAVLGTSEWKPRVGDLIGENNHGVIEAGIDFFVVAVLDDKVVMAIDLVQGSDHAYGCDDAMESLELLLAIAGEAVVTSLATKKATK